MKNNFLARTIATVLTGAATLLCAVGIQAQSLQLSGKVSDDQGEPLAGVTVSAVGTTIGTLTAGDGSFRLSVPASTKELRFSMLGMKELILPIGSSSVFDVSMETDIEVLNEAVAVGYGTMIRKDISSSVASVTSESLNERASAINLSQSLAGKLAGVQAMSSSGRPGGSMRIRVRGKGSINASSNPLYVLDGVVDVDPNMINSNDVESIDVLKDAAATAVYGAKGANGVVIITTKSGKSGEGTVTFDSKTGVNILTRRIDMLNAEEFMEVQRMAYEYSGTTMPHLTTPMENMFWYKKDSAGNYEYDENGLLIASPKYNTNWVDEVMRPALVTDNSLSFRKNAGGTSIYAGLSYQDVGGMVMNTYAKRFSGTINIKSKINEWLDIQALANAGNSSSNNADNEGTMFQGALRNMIEMPPIVPVKYEDGTWGSKSDYPLGEEADNPVKQLQMMQDISRVNYLLMNLSLNFHLTKDLTLTVKGDYQNQNNKNTHFAEAGIKGYSENAQGNTNASIANADSRRISNEDYLTWNRNFFQDRLRSSFVLGTSLYYYHTESSRAEARDIPEPLYEYHNLGTGTTLVAPSSGMSQITMNSFYFRMNHSLLDRYLFGFTFRADGASNFGSNHRYGYFPSASFGWIVSEEPWFEGLRETVNHAKFRLSYGSVGNASISPYNTFAQYASGNRVFNNQLVPQVVLGNLGNNDLTWETARQFDTGLDLSFFNDRLQLIADFYIKRNMKLLYNKDVPWTTGYGSTLSNIGELKNTGFELTINSHNISRPDFSWDTDFIFSTNKTIAVDLGGDIIGADGALRTDEGQIWQQWHVFQRLGVWGTNEVEEAAKYGKYPGDIKYLDVDTNYTIDDDDRVYCGQPAPKAEFSLVNTVFWKGLTCMLDLGAQVGHKIFSTTHALIDNQIIYTNGQRGILNSWTPEHQDTMYPALRHPGDHLYGENIDDTFHLYDASFLRIRNVSLAYDFGYSVLKRSKLFKGLILGVSVENPYVFTKYPGYDPEISWLDDSASGFGRDWYAYPRPMTITGNLKITF